MIHSYACLKMGILVQFKLKKNQGGLLNVFGFNEVGERSHSQDK